MEINQNTHQNTQKKKAGLGRGLGSLLGEIETVRAAATTAASINSEVATPEPVSDANRILLADVTQLKGNPTQPRRNFDPEKLRELSASIKEKGIIQPILVRRTDEKNSYEIIAGERRWRAAQLAGLQEVPIIVKDSDDKTTLELALIENIQRADLGPLEEAEAYQRLASDHKMTQSEIAQKVGKDRATVANSIRLLELPSEIKELVKGGNLSVGHAKVLLSMPSHADQISIAREVVQKKLSVRATEKLVAERLSPAQLVETEISGVKEEGIQRIVVKIAEDLQKTLGTKVQIDYRDQKGKLTLHFYSDEELNRLVDKLKTPGK